MATPRETGPYIYPTWLPKLLAGLDSCEWKSGSRSTMTAGPGTSCPATPT